MRSKICRNSPLQVECDTLIARSITGCVLVEDIGRRLLLELQFSLYQDQQGDANQSVRESYKTGFGGGQKLTAVEGIASVNKSVFCES